MFLSKSKYSAVVLCSIVLLAVMLASLTQQIDVLDTTPRARDIFRYRGGYGENETVLVDDSPGDILWFLQISDLHISIFHDQSRIVELRQFCCETVSIIEPSVVISSGDLTDAKLKNNMGSTQFRDEWIIYADVLDKCSIKNKTLWLDIRGNHDNFDVPGWKSRVNYFKRFSVQGTSAFRSYMRVVEKDNVKYAFIGVDACLEPGPRRPFNFIGMLTNNDTANIRRFIQRANEMNVQHFIWFGHYPTSCILSLRDDSLRNLIGDEIKSKVYMCGHLHQMGGLLKEMYTLQKPGYLELELGDWKDSRVFRLAAIDHGLFSFTDVVHGKWPIVLITNPKNALYTMPLREPLLYMKRSTHIRLLAFSLSPIQSVTFKIDDGKWGDCVRAEGPLFVAHWNPNKYSSGLHTLQVHVRDVMGRVITVSQPFSLDGSRTDFKTLAKIVLMMDASKMFQCLFGIMILISTLPIVILRFIHQKTKEKKIAPSQLKKNIIHNWIKKMWLLSIVDRIFYPLIIYEIYMIFGPWSFGEIIAGHFGVIFSWGVFVNGSFIPGSFTYAYGFIQMFFCQFPLTLVLASNVFNRYLFHWHGKSRNTSLVLQVLKQFPFILIISIQMLYAYFFFLAYGTIAFLLGPFRTWSVILNIYLWYTSLTLPPTITREATKVSGLWRL